MNKSIKMLSILSLTFLNLFADNADALTVYKSLKSFEGKMIDQTNLLKKIELKDSTVIQYQTIQIKEFEKYLNIKVSNLKKDKKEFEIFKKNMIKFYKEDQSQNLCVNDKTKMLKKGISFQYVLDFSDGTKLGETTISQKDCN